MDQTSIRDFLGAAVGRHEQQIVELSDRIFEFAETGFREFRSAELMAKRLEAEGFTVERGTAGIPTAFTARFGKGKPAIGLLAEYDALPGLSQEGGITERRPKEGNPDGHGCGHNLLGAGVFAAAVAVKEYLELHPDRGTVILFGCPSEEKGNAKTLMARDGIFHGIDAAITWHPADGNYAVSFSSLANISVYFDFLGTTSHAAAAPHLGRSALDAAELMNVGVNYLREHVIQEARIHYAYTDAGGIAPNVVQGTSRLHYFIRAPKAEQVLEIFERVKDIAKGAALMTGTKNHYEIYSGLSDFVPNRTLTTILHEAMVDTGAPEFDEADYALAAKFAQEAFPENAAADGGGEPAQGAAVPVRCLDSRISELNWNMPLLPGSTDVGDVSHVVPTAQCSYAALTRGTAMHTWQATAHGNTAIAHKAVLAAGKAMALAAVRVMEDEEVQIKMREDWKRETGGIYHCPIPAEVKPRLED